MALLQIMDPVAKPVPIGIDLGTTHSLVAYVPLIGPPTAIVDCDGHALVPSVVSYREHDGVVVGKQAVALALAHPQDTLASVKRFMGRGADDLETKKLASHSFATAEGKVVRFSLSDGSSVTPIEVSAEILRALRQRAEDAIGAVGPAVITVPAHFDDAQRQATRDAGKLAGLEVLRLLNEPTAAALAYGLDSRKQGTFAVYDLGGGTFDITILLLDQGVFQVRSTGGDTQLGGDDMDRALAEVFLRELGRDSAHARADVVRALLDAARATKHALTDREAVDLELALPDGSVLSYCMTRAELDALVRPLCERTGAVCGRALRDAGLRAEDLDGVILVGGATRVPCVRAYVTELFGKAPLDTIDPDQVVALGAAIQADQLAGERQSEPVLLLDVLPLSLGIESMGGVVEKILPRNTPIPTAAAQVFTTYADNQSGFELHVVQGEREHASDCRSLAHFTLRGIPPMPAGIVRLQVRFEVDADGILHVSARELTTGVSQTIDVKPSYGLSDEEVERMLLEAYDYAESDVARRSLIEQRVDAERILQATHAAMRVDAALLEPAEREEIEVAMHELREAANGEDSRVIASRIQSLDHASKAFAGRRMDLRIREALAGRRVDDVEQRTAHAKGIEGHLKPEQSE